MLFSFFFFLKITRAILRGVTWCAGCSERRLGRWPALAGSAARLSDASAWEEISACFSDEGKGKGMQRTPHTTS